MIIKIISILFFVMFGVYMYGQAPVTDNKIDTIPNELKLARSHFKYLVNEEFGNIVGSQSRSNLGNYASLDIKDAEVTFGGNILFKKGSVLSVKASGGISEGTLPFFSDNEINPKVGINLQYNFIVGNISLSYDRESFRAYDQKRKGIINNREKELNKIQNKHPKSSRKLVIARLQQKKQELKKGIEFTAIQNKHFNSLEMLKKSRLQADIVKLNKKIESEENKDRRDSLLAEVENIQFNLSLPINNTSETTISANNMAIDSIDFLIQRLENEIKELPTENTILLEGIKQKYDNELNELESDTKKSQIDIEGFEVCWVTIGTEFNNRKFKLFDPNQASGSQVKKDAYASLGFNMQYSTYKLSSSPYKSYFNSFGISYKLEDNLNTLNDIELIERVNYGMNLDDRYVESKSKVYLGEYKNNLSSLKLYSNLYWFLFDKNIGAVHLYPELKFKKDQKASFNWGTGFMLSFKDKNDKDNIINSELYLLANDIFNSNKSEKKLFKRSEIGIQFTFPITFKSKDYGKESVQK